MDFKDVVRSLPDEELDKADFVIEEEKRRRGEKNKKLEDELAKSLVSYTGFISCNVRYRKWGDRSETSNVTITFAKGEVKIETIYTDHGTRRAIELNTSFGDISIRYSGGRRSEFRIRSDTLVPIQIDDWTTYDTLALLGDVFRVTMKFIPSDARSYDIPEFRQ